MNTFVIFCTCMQFTSWIMKTFQCDVRSGGVCCCLVFLETKKVPHNLVNLGCHVKMNHNHTF